MWSLLAWLKHALLLLLPVLLILLYKQHKNKSEYAKKVNKIPGPPFLPLLGNLLDMWQSPVQIFSNFYRDLAQFGPVFRFWILQQPQIVLQRARDVEKILQPMIHHIKSKNYDFLKEWMGEGLLTSRDEKWKVHRKVLTPAFHFNILHEFFPIFNKQAYELTCQLDKARGKISDEGINVFNYIAPCALDIICESSMGIKIDAQKNDQSPYAKSIVKMNEILVKRYFTPWLRPDFLFQFSSTKKEFDETLETINSFTDRAISERRSYLKTRGFENATSAVQTYKSDGKRRLALMDLLLTAEADGTDYMTQKDIRDQVSTFMFEGHDTVATATCWALFIIGTYPAVQEKVVAELEEIFGDSGRFPDMNDLSKMKYLELCIKEILRLYPSVPFFERHVTEDAQIEHHVIPGGCNVSMNVYMLHRDPEFWPEPEKFDPERFSPENSVGRNPYAYVPFSAGPRNCIGQKFAMLEEKAVLSTVLRRFRVEAAHSRDDAILQISMVLRPQNGLKVRFFDRDSHPNLRVNPKLLE